MINGYPYLSRIFPGANLVLCVSSDSAKFKVDFYRQGATLKFVGSKTWSDGIKLEPAGDGVDWGWKAHYFLIPPDWISGVYIAMFFELDARGRQLPSTVDPTVSYGKTSKALFVVKNPNAGKKHCILYKIPLFTYHAYNGVEGYSGNFYRPPVQKITLHRTGGGTGGTPWDDILYPDDIDKGSPRQTFAHWDAPFISWMEANGYGADYCTDLDIHENANNFLSSYHLLISAGHDEYWSREMRNHIEQFISAGGNVAFFSGNTCFWQIRLEDYNTSLVCYKGNGTADPVYSSNPSATTIRWSDTIINYPENLLTGTSYVNGAGWWDPNRPSIGYTAQNTSHWVYQGTGLAETDQFGENDFLVGYEADGCLIEYDTVANLFFSTGTDKTPSNFVVLAYAFLNGWEHERDLSLAQVATMGIYTRNGTVFNAATTDWARVLASGNLIVDKITKNVLDRLRARSIRIIGPATKVCGHAIAVQGSKALFHADTSSFPAGANLKFTWSASDGTAQNFNNASFEIILPVNNNPLTISVTVDDGSDCKGFGTKTLTAVTGQQYQFMQLICKLSHMMHSNILLLGSGERFKHFVDPLWDPLKGDLRINLSVKELKVILKDVKDLNRIVVNLQRITLKNTRTKK